MRHMRWQGVLSALLLTLAGFIFRLPWLNFSNVMSLFGLFLLMLTACAVATPINADGTLNLVHYAAWLNLKTGSHHN